MAQTQSRSALGGFQRPRDARRAGVAFALPGVRETAVGDRLRYGAIDAPAVVARERKTMSGRRRDVGRRREEPACQRGPVGQGAPDAVGGVRQGRRSLYRFGGSIVSIVSAAIAESSSPWLADSSRYALKAAIFSSQNISYSPTHADTSFSGAAFKR